MSIEQREPGNGTVIAGDDAGRDLSGVDRRGSDLRGLDLRRAQDLLLAELVTLDAMGWLPVAAWDEDTRFPPELDDMLWLMGLRDSVYGRDPALQEEAMERGRRARLVEPLDKSGARGPEVPAFWWADG